MMNDPAPAATGRDLAIFTYGDVSTVRGEAQIGIQRKLPYKAMRAAPERSKPG
jgi:hypothetical protein